MANVVDTTVTPGKCIVPSSNDRFVVATRENRDLYGFASAFVRQTGAANRGVIVQAFGEIPASVAGLGAGESTYVRVADDGSLERTNNDITTSDDIVGRCRADGSVSLFSDCTRLHWRCWGTGSDANYSGHDGRPVGDDSPHHVPPVFNQCEQHEKRRSVRFPLRRNGWKSAGSPWRRTARSLSISRRIRRAD